MKSLTGLSINEICRMHKFNTLAGGFDPADHHYSITGETLRRRYYDAVRLLRAEQREREETILLFKRFGAHSPLLDSPLPIASVWSAELRCRLA
ncbi:MAG TPA: hypothetical protein VGN83_25575 [Falsiroseomonas sp.]|nr:hypothetical protein [Falsiroseomonas sp.]